MRAWFRRLVLRHKIRWMLPRLTEVELTYFYETMRSCTAREWKELTRLTSVREEARTMPLRAHLTPPRGEPIGDDDVTPRRLPRLPKAPKRSE